MAILPINTYENPLDEQVEYKTLISQFDGGAESRKQKYTYPRRNFSLSYKYLSKANALTLWDFYMERKGAYEAFYFVLPWTNTYTKEYVDSGDGSTVLFNAPSKSAASYDVYLDNVAQTVTTDYTVGSSGEESTNQITFVVAPNDGEKITFSFTGYLKVRVRFSEDMFSFQTFYDRLVNTGVKLKGLIHG
jgi:hypothetical protein